MKKLFLLLLTFCIMAGFGTVQSAKADTLALSLVVDGSGSISSTNWANQIDAYATAIENVVPKDGTVALNVIQFGTDVTQEIEFTVINDTTIAGFLTDLRAISQKDTRTNISGGIELAVETLQAFDTGMDYDRWVIDVSTDGEHNEGIDPLTASMNAVNNGNVDAINAIGIGSAAALGFEYGANSFAITADWADFDQALERKLIREITNVPEPATALLFGIGLLGLAGMGRKKS